MRISDWSSDVCSSDLALDRYTGRSPGERGETDILKGKARRIADRLFGRRVNSGGPEQRALGKIFDTPPEDSINELSQTPGPIALPDPVPTGLLPRSEERRVGKECVSPFRSRWSPVH